MAEHLGQTEGAALVLSGRRQCSDADQEWLDAMRSQGVRVSYRQMDLGDRQQVQDVFDSIKAELGSVSGIVHSAGMVRDAMIVEKDLSEIELVFRAKVSGTIHLDEVTRDEALDFFVCFASGAGVLGNPGQSDYAAANAFLNAFAYERSAQVASGARHGRSVSIAWGLWSDGGMGVDEATARMMESHAGMMAMPSVDGLDAMDRAIHGGPASIMVIYGHADKIRKSVLAKTKETPAPSVRNVSASAVLRTRIADALVRVVADLLKIPAAELDPRADMSEFGFDSVTFTELVNNLNDRYDLDLGTTVLFEYPTLDSFVSYLAEAYAHHFEEEPPIEPPVRSRVFATGPSANRLRDVRAKSTSTATPDAVTRADGVRLGAQADSNQVETGAIAVVGMSGMFPGAGDLDTFWNNLEAGVDSVTEIPKDRWDWREYFPDGQGGEGKTRIKWAGFMPDVDKFDAVFFGISPREAKLMDPMERLFLQAAWKAMEDAGHSKSDLARTCTGVFAGVGVSDYSGLLKDKGITQGFGAAPHFWVANRVSYALNLNGPSASIDTACSSSLVAIHRAIKAIESGECVQAIAGGVNTVVSPDLFISVEQSGVLSEDGKCKAFDSGANGYVRAEGVAALLLKPLHLALRDRNPIYGVIRGSAENHGGHTSGVTVPNPNAQSDVLVTAYEKAGFDMSMVDYFEAHGTGTALGDPIEVNGILKAARALSGNADLERRPELRCALGSVKANIGHLEAAAGIASVVKVLLAMKHGVLPGNIHLENLNAEIRTEGSGFYLPAENRPWIQRSDEAGNPMPRRAGVSSFGVGGSNAHVALEQWPEPASDVQTEVPVLIVLSARNQDRLKAMVQNLRQWPLADLGAAAYTLQVGRDAFSDRAAFYVASIEDLHTQLDQFLSVPSPTDSGAATVAKEIDAAEVRRAMVSRDWVALGELWVQGFQVPWSELYEAPLERRVALPTYPFKPKRCWFDVGEKVVTPRARPVVQGVRSDSVTTQIVDGRIAVVTMRDRERRNMLSDAIVGGLIDAFGEIAKNPEIRAVVVTGSDGVFGMGGTEEWLVKLVEGQSTCVDVPFLYEGLLRMDVPVIAAMQGHAAGGSLIFGLYADMIVMAEEGVYSANFMKYGFTPGMGATYIMERKLGTSLATEMMFTAKWFRGEELRDRGAPFSFRPAAAVLDEAIDMARMLAEKSPDALRILKHHTSGRILEELPRVLAQEVAMQDETLRNPEVKARITEQFRKAAQRVDIAPVQLKSPREVSDTRPPASGRTKIRLTALGAEPEPNLPAEVPVTPPLPSVDNRAPRDVVSALTPSSVGEEVAAIVMSILDMDDDDLDDRLSFRELGVDSIGAVEIVRDINKQFHLNIEAAILYDYPTVDALAGFVAAQTSRSAAEPSGMASPEPEVVPEPTANRKPAERREPVADTEPVTVPDPATPGRADTVRETSDIAIVGMSGRFPGAPDIETFWANIANRTCSVGEAPAERWDVREFYDPDPNAPGKSYCKWGGFLDEIDRFDPLFFNLSGLEAEQMDPQQRVFLETAWHAVEDAGYAPQSLKTKTCGVFVGVGTGDYGLLLQEAGVGATPQSFMGTHVSILPARIAYHLNLTGPTMAIDTACSSSMVAIHQACQSLLHQDCDMALAGGVSVMATPAMYIPTSKAAMLSPTGLCKTFDDSADGFVPGEGVGVLVLKRLDRAIEDGDTVHAVIKASGVNQDGASNGITAPSAASQRSLIQGIYQRGGVDPSRIGYVEAHGTGTRLGDPIEVRALTDAFQSFTPSAGYCAIGSVKTNVGHSLAAAGIAGIVKAVMALRSRQLPPTLHCENENRHIDFQASPFYVNRELKAWPGVEGKPRQAAVSSFGFSGTNAHIVLEEYAADRKTRNVPPLVSGRALIVLSAKSADQLSKIVRGLWGALEANVEGLALADIAYTLQTGREAMGYRLATVVESLDALRHQLDAASNRQPGDDAPGWFSGRVKRARDLFPIGADEAPTQIARQWVRGGTIDWNILYPDARPGRVGLPGYPFARERFWIRTEKDRPGEIEPEVFSATTQWMTEPGERHADASDAGAPAVDRFIFVDEALIDDVIRVQEAWPSAQVIPLDGVGPTPGERAENRFLQVFDRLQECIAARPVRTQVFLILAPVDVDESGYVGLAALLKTAHLENPHITGKVVYTYGAVLRVLEEESSTMAGVEEVRYSDASSEREVRRIREATLVDPPSPIKEGGVYWITGGGGGLGRIVAGHLASVEGVRIVLSGRSQGGGEHLAWIDDLRQRGVAIDYIQADVGDRKSAEAAFGQIKGTYGRLDGVIHSAGVVRDAYLLKKTPEQVTEVLRPKIRGAVVLDDITRDEPLDFMALFSSGSGALGNVGQCDYAAANAFLDGFARSRNVRVDKGARSGRTVSFGWPLWDEGGMGVDAETWAVLRKESGAVPLPSDLGMRLFERALCSPYDYVLLAVGDRERLGDRLLRRPDTVAAGAPDQVTLDSVSRDQVVAHFKHLLGSTLKVPVERIESDAPFEEYGIDSVMVVGLNSRLEEAFGPLSRTLFFECQTLDELVDYFIAAHGAVLAGVVGSGDRETEDRIDRAIATDFESLAERYLEDDISEDDLSRTI